MKKIIWSAVFIALIQTAFAQNPEPGSYENKQGGTQDQNGYPQSGNPTGTNQNVQPPNQNENVNTPNATQNGNISTPNTRQLPASNPNENRPGANQNVQPQNQNGTMNSPNQASNQNGNAWDYNNTGATQIEIDNLPASINNSFHQKYPDQQNATWYRSASGYTVRYPGSNHMEEELIYDANGRMIGKGMQMNVTELPQNTITYLVKNNKGQAYKTAHMITPSTGTKYYEVFVNGKWMKFDSNGNYVPIK